MLEGKVIAITRREENARDFVQLVETNGGKAVAIPTISIIPRDDRSIQKFHDLLMSTKHDYVLFMSANAVKIVFDVLTKQQKASAVVSTLNSGRVIAVGPHTKEALESNGVIVRLMPRKYSSYGILEILSTENCRGKKIIIPRSSASTNFLAKELSNHDMVVDEVYVYDVGPAEHDKWDGFMELLMSRSIDCIIFTSASSVSSFFEIATNFAKEESIRNVLNSIRIVAIGPFTNEALRGYGVEATVSQEHTIRGSFETAAKLLGGVS